MILMFLVEKDLKHIQSDLLLKAGLTLQQKQVAQVLARSGWKILKGRDSFFQGQLLLIFTHCHGDPFLKNKTKLVSSKSIVTKASISTF